MTRTEAIEIGLCLTCATYSRGVQFCQYTSIRQHPDEARLCMLTEAQIEQRRREYAMADGRFTNKYIGNLGGNQWPKN